MKNKIDFYDKNSIEILVASGSHTFPLHSHSCFCFGIVEDGTVRFTVRGHSRELTAGMADSIPPETGVKIETSSSYRYITICIKGSQKERLNSFNYSDYFMTFPTSEPVRRICSEYMADSSASADDTLISSITELMRPVISGTSSPSEKRSSVVSDARRYIIEHAGSAFSLNELAAFVHVSKYYLVKLFKKEMGVTPHQYYVQAKIRIVKDSITEAENSSDLAQDLGFNDQSHMCNLFKKEMGISPVEYKKSIRPK